MRWLALVLLLLVAALQYTMWLGKGGWLQVRELSREIDKQQQINSKLKARNDALDADVRDLKGGVEAIEERARGELGMVRGDEVFFQLQPRTGNETPHLGSGESNPKAVPAPAAPHPAGAHTQPKHAAVKAPASANHSSPKAGDAKGAHSAVQARTKPQAGTSQASAAGASAKPPRPANPPQPATVQ